MIRLLLVSNQAPNSSGLGNPIVLRMRDALAKDPRIEKVDFFPFYNYLKTLFDLRRTAKGYDIVHVHFGGLYALLILCSLVGIKAKKYITFHGTDIHAKALKTTKSKLQKFKIWLNQKASFVSLYLFHRCGFVSEDLPKYVPTNIQRNLHHKMFVQNLGVNYDLFKIMDKDLAQKELALPLGNYVLFSDVSNTNIKRRDIAAKIVAELGDDYKLLVMSGVKPAEVPVYINACSCALLTSDEEGSPNIIREVLSLNKPFFSVDVGDAARQLAGLQNSAIISRDPKIAAMQIKERLSLMYTDNTRQAMRNLLDFTMVNKAVVDIYQSDLK